MLTPERRSELERNFYAFMQLLPGLLPEHEGQFALMREGKVIAYHTTSRDAVIAGRRQFGDDLFSVQQVRRTEADFGWFSRVSANPHP
jgi:hypothetical protein